MPDNNSEKEISVLDLIGLIFKNLKWIIGITGLFMIYIVIYAVVSIKMPSEKSYMPNVYSPVSTVMLNSGGSSSGSFLSGSGMGALAGLAGLGSSEGPTDKELAIKIATSNSFIDKLDSEFSLGELYNTKSSPQPRTNLKKRITNKLQIQKSDAGMLEISYTDKNKKLATDIVNKVTDLLEEEFININKIKNKTQFTVVEEKKAIVEKEMKRLQDAIIQFQIENKIIDVNIVSTEIVKLISGLQAELLSKEVEIESYGKVANKRDPQYIKLVNEKDAILNAIGKLENGEVGDYPPISLLPQLALELEELKRAHDVQLAGYKALIQQAETLKLTAEGTGPTFQIFEVAEIPEVKSGPSRGKMCIMYTFIGFFASLVFVFLKEIFFYLKARPDLIDRIKGKK